jgi:hypothetical protein
MSKGKPFVTLRDSANYILKLPKAKRDAPQWQAAAEARTCLPRSYKSQPCFRYNGPGPSCGMLSGKQGVDAMTVENPNVKSIWTTIEVDKDGVETVLVVETDLELNAADPAFDVAKVDALIEAAMKSFAASGGTIDRVHLVPIR